MSYIERLDKDSNTCQLSSFWWITIWENENLPYIHAYVMLLHKHPLKSYSVSLYRSQCLRALSFLRLRAVLFISVSLTPSIIAGLCVQHAYEMIEWNNLLPLKFFSFFPLYFYILAYFHVILHQFGYSWNQNFHLLGELCASSMHKLERKPREVVKDASILADYNFSLCVNRGGIIYCYHIL